MCKLYDILYALVPLAAFRDRLIRRHFERCPRCVRRYGLDLAWEVDACQPENLWPGIAARISRPITRFPAEEPTRPTPLHGLAYAAATALFLFIMTGFLTMQSIVRPGRLVADQGRSEFSLVSARIEGESANTFIFKPQGAPLVIVYYKKS